MNTTLNRIIDAKCEAIEEAVSERLEEHRRKRPFRMRRVAVEKREVLISTQLPGSVFRRAEEVANYAGVTVPRLVQIIVERYFGGEL